jgi:acetyl-CoA carboxylase biotin carboxyl carrier protein
MVLRYKEIGEIIRLVDSSSCEEIVLETEEIKLIVRRRGAARSAPSADPASAVTPPVQASGSVSPAIAHTKPSASPPATGAASAGVISSPMVGIFYRAPSPDAPPFVDVGTKVKTGDPLCVIEVMKLFTTIHAEFGGTVREIGAENAQLVEFGQMLFVVNPE